MNSKGGKRKHTQNRPCMRHCRTPSGYRNQAKGCGVWGFFPRPWGYEGSAFSRSSTRVLKPNFLLLRPPPATGSRPKTLTVGGGCLRENSLCFFLRKVLKWSFLRKIGFKEAGSGVVSVYPPGCQNGVVLVEGGSTRSNWPGPRVFAPKGVICNPDPSAFAT